MRRCRRRRRRRRRRFSQQKCLFEPTNLLPQENIVLAVIGNGSRDGLLQLSECQIVKLDKGITHTMMF